jgi:hypothetical protein
MMIPRESAVPDTVAGKQAKIAHAADAAESRPRQFRPNTRSSTVVS